MSAGQKLRSAVAITMLLTCAVAGLTSLTVPAIASAKEPTGDFAIFKQCPRFTAGVTLCLYTKTLSGEVVIHKSKVPINEDKKHPLILQGGIKEEGGKQSFVGALNGETLPKVPQNVPGGLTGLVNCTEIKGEGVLEGLARAACKVVFENKTTGVSAVTELAKPASSIGINTAALETSEGPVLSLPVKVKLENTFLGSECYIGSSTTPINLNLTAGRTSPALPNKPIEGKPGFPTFKDEFEIVEILENTLVNNEFSAPGATGCGGIFAFLIDPIIDSKLGLPAPNGLNTAIQNNVISEGTAEGVIKSEK